MTCQEAQRLISRYIKKELSRAETDAFLEHVMSCPECYQELEIYYTIDAGLRELDGERQPIRTLKETIEQSMKESRTELSRNKLRQDIFYGSSTVVFWAVATAVVMELIHLHKLLAAAGIGFRG